jgi:hypothetical protein
MKIHPVDGGSAAHFALRIGIPCTSGFQNIITPKGVPTTGERRRSYMHRLIAERLLDYSMESRFENHWMLRGRELEPQAADAFGHWAAVPLLGDGVFITSDDGRVGASPDRLLGLHEALEIKCPSPPVQVGYLLEGPGADYKQQVQGQLWVGEFEAVHFWAWHPQMPPVHVATERDEGFIEKLAAAVTAFCDELDQETERCRRMGLFIPGQEPPLDIPGRFPWMQDEGTA